MTRSFKAAVAALLLSFSAVVLPSNADAAKSKIGKAMWGPVSIDGKSQFPIYRDLGVGLFQYGLSWRNVAPTKPADPRDPDDPAYEWPAELDLATTEARKYRIRMLLMVIQTPDWANGGDVGSVPPTRAADYADFVEAVAKRYPRVRHWMVWGEPIRYGNFRIPLGPGSENPRKRLAAGQRSAIRKYASMLDKSYARLKARTKRNIVIGGNTTTTGDMLPETFIRNLRLANGKVPRMDIFGHNPFGTRGPDLKKRQIKRGSADFSDLDVLVRWLDRHLARNGRNRKLRVFISEYNAPTGPGFEFKYHVTPRLQAKWITDGLRISRRWNRIYSFGWHSLRDIVTSDGKRSPTGLIAGNGKRKPGYYAFKRG